MSKSESTETSGKRSRPREIVTAINSPMARRTVDFITTVLGPEQDRHIDFLTIHPRTRYTPSSTPISVEALEILTSTFGKKVPILVSGDVFTLNTLPFTSPISPPTEKDKDGDRSQLSNIPNLAGLMSARAILSNPALYAGFDRCPWSAVDTFLNKTARCPIPFKLVLHHISEMCAPGMGPNKTALLNRRDRSALQECANMVDLIDFLDAKREGGIRRDGDEERPAARVW